MHKLNRGKKVAQICEVPLSIKKKLPKVNNRPNGRKFAQFGHPDSAPFSIESKFGTLKRFESILFYSDLTLAALKTRRGAPKVTPYDYLVTQNSPNRMCDLVVLRIW
jgi:hypothetical protein